MPLHATDIRTYLECQRKFKYANIDRLKPLDGYNRPEYFDFGTEAHKILADHYRGIEPDFEAIENQDWQTWLMTFYKLYKSEYQEKDQSFQIASVENSIGVDLKGYKFEFTMDVLVLNTGVKPKPVYQPMDHKFYKSFPDPKTLEMDFQFSFYLWATRKSGINASSLIGNYIRKTMPRYLVPGKRGELSKAKKELAETEYDLYLESIKTFNLDPANYKEELDYLKARGSNFLKRFIVRRSAKELESFENNLLTILDEIHSDKKNFLPIPSLGCKDCIYHFLCKVENNCGNVDGVKESLFEVKDDGER